MSTAETCVLRSDFGSLTWTGRPGKSVVAMDSTLLSASSGGVGAKMASSPACRICLATNLLRMFGLVLSPLLTSTHLTVTGGLPVTRLASPMGLFSHTTLASK